MSERRQTKSVRMPSGEVISFPVRICPTRKAKGCLRTFSAKPKAHMRSGEALQSRERSIT